MTKSKIKAQVGMVVCKGQDGMTEDGYEWLEKLNYNKDTKVHELVSMFNQTLVLKQNDINELKGIVQVQSDEIKVLKDEIKKMRDDLNNLTGGAI
jgi:capsule polysaccharide export protein KpsE/RkpR